MELEELKQKIDTFLDINKELVTVGMCDITHDSGMGHLQLMIDDLISLSEKYSLKLNVDKRNDVEFPWKVSIPELKIYAVATNKGVAKLP
ncbi:MAG: hypothetical protein WC365_00705 [Candidatus Babeliales bacterium]|jgi:hypothetical protein